MFLYCLESGPGGPLKIGVTTINAESRVYSLQTGNPEELRVVAQRPGKPMEEAALHRRFADLRIRGEWFQRDPSILAEFGL